MQKKRHLVKKGSLGTQCLFLKRLKVLLCVRAGDSLFVTYRIKQNNLALVQNNLGTLVRGLLVKAEDRQAQAVRSQQAADARILPKH